MEGWPKEGLITAVITRLQKLKLLELRCSCHSLNLNHQQEHLHGMLTALKALLATSGKVEKALYHVPLFPQDSAETCQQVHQHWLVSWQWLGLAWGPDDVMAQLQWLLQRELHLMAIWKMGQVHMLVWIQ